MLKVGMYVRCLIDEDVNYPRIFVLGQIVNINIEKNLVGVKFHDPFNFRGLFTHIPSSKWYGPDTIMRTNVFVNTIVKFKGANVRVIGSRTNQDKNDCFTYFIEYLKSGEKLVGEVSESQLEIPFTKADLNPLIQMGNYELHNPQWYMKRKVVSKSLNIINNSPYGFKHILGTRVQLYNHQVDTIIRALSEKPCRLLLADEVGLGKTIEALSIMSAMIDKKSEFHTLIVVPRSLVYQWQTELSFKFWIDSPIWNVDIIDKEKVVLITIEDFVNNYNQIRELRQWDMCIVDETHRSLYNDNYYKTLSDISEQVENILLLSATPILHREVEYHKLLSLLKPDRFKKMDKFEFEGIILKQSFITNVVFNLMQDIPDYINYDLAENFICELNDLNEQLNDKILSSIILNIDKKSDDKGLSDVKLALAYISEFYQIDRNIIRHRRKELEFLNITRKLVDISHEMTGSDVGTFEENTYNDTISYIEYYIEHNGGKIDDFILDLMTASTSTPHALIAMIDDRLFITNLTSEEKQKLLDLKRSCIRWESSLNKELRDIKNLSNDIDNFHSKIAKLIDHIDQEDLYNDKKYLIFTGYTKTALILERFFKSFFGLSSTASFHKEKTQEQMQEAASEFQNTPECRFMICDESGGEGRNFQIADYIVHFDLPWSPSMLEQRIGRLDRIGRETGKDVISIVLYSFGTIENQIFELFNKGLRIFNESLCGLEIAFEEIENTIKDAINKDIRFGLVGIIEDIIKLLNFIKEEVEKEVYYDLARQLDVDLYDKLQKLITHFSDNDGEELMNTMMAWPSMAGFQDYMISDAFGDGTKVISIDTSRPNIKSMQNALYYPPRMDEIIRKSRYKDDIRGTFSRKGAVKHENLTFFAPSNKFFDSITNNAEECYKGRCSAFRFTGSKFEYRGLLMTWNIIYNPERLYAKGYTLEYLSVINRYLPTEQIHFARGFNKDFNKIQGAEILEEVDLLYKRNKAFHLGKRGNNQISEFISVYKPEEWYKYLNKSYRLGKKRAKEEALYLIDSCKAREDLETILIASKSKELFYGYKDQEIMINSQDIIEALIYGLENPIIELDSIVFVELEKGRV